MPIIHQTQIDEIIAGLPELEPLEDSQLQFPGSQILLIAAAGFEDRARTLIERLPSNVWNDLILVRYPTNESDNEPCLDAFRNLEISGARVEIAYNSGTLWKELGEKLSTYGVGEDWTVIVDISGMSSYVLYPVFEAITRRLPKATLATVYIEADQYHPRKDAWQAFRESIADLSSSLEIAERYQQSGKFESQGPTSVYGSQLFPGNNLDSLATQLVAIPSFSLERMKEMLAYAEDQYNVARDEIHWVFGKPPDRQKNGWRLDAQMELYCARDDQRSVTVSTRHYTDLIRLLDETWEHTSADRHMVVASVGSKMQHMGVFLFLKMHPEVGLVLSEPKEFIAKQYSDGTGPKWWLNFGRVEELTSLLRGRGHLKFQW